MRSALFPPAALAVLLLAACHQLVSTGLDADPFGDGYSASTSLEVRSTRYPLELEGRYRIDSGSLTLEVISPEGDTVLQRTWLEGQSGRIEESFAALPGVWRVSLESAGSGAASVQLYY